MNAAPETSPQAATKKEKKRWPLPDADEAQIQAPAKGAQPKAARRPPKQSPFAGDLSQPEGEAPAAAPAAAVDVGRDNRGGRSGRGSRGGSGRTAAGNCGGKKQQAAAAPPRSAANHDSSDDETQKHDELLMEAAADFFKSEDAASYTTYKVVPAKDVIQMKADNKDPNGLGGKDILVARKFSLDQGESAWFVGKVNPLPPRARCECS